MKDRPQLVEERRGIRAADSTYGDLQAAAVRSGQHPAGFLDQDETGREVPRHEDFLPERVERTLSQVAEVQGRRTGSSDTGCRSENAVELSQIRR